MNIDTQHITVADIERIEAIMVTDASGIILHVNEAFQQMTGYRPDEVTGKTPRILNSGRHDPAFFATMWQKMIEDGAWEGEIWDRRKSGQIYPKWMTIAALKDIQGKTIQYTARFIDITDQAQTEKEISDLGYYDPLTGLPNHRLLMELFNSSLSVSERTRHYGVVFLLNMDNLKHAKQSDFMLQQIAERIRYNMRAVDTIARLTNDEFAVVAVNLGVIEERARYKADLIAEKIRTILSVPYHVEGIVQHCTASIGACLFNGNAVAAESLIEIANTAMCEAQNAGGNLVRFIQPSPQH